MQPHKARAMRRKPLNAPATDAGETRRFRMRAGFVIHQGRFVRRGGEVVDLTREEYRAHMHKLEDGLVPDDEADADV